MPQGMQEEHHRNQREEGKGGRVEPGHRIGPWRLVQIKAASQIPQNEIFKGDCSAGAQILNIALGTEGFNLGKIVRHFLAIQFKHASVHRQATLLGTFDIVQAQRTLEGRIDFRLIHELNHQYIKTTIGQRVQPPGIAIGIKEVTEHDSEPPLAALPGIITQHPIEIRTTLPLQGLKIAKQSKDLLPATLRRHRSTQFISKRHGANAVETIETDIAQRCRHASGIVQLRWGPHLHRLAGINKEMNGEVFFGSKDLEKQMIETAIDIPVDITEIIPSVILPVITKLQTHAAAQCGPVVLTLPPKDLACQQTQGLQLAHELRIEQGALHASVLSWRLLW